MIKKQPNYINKDEILITNSNILDDLSDLDKRQKEYEDLMNDNKLDFKYLSYNDQPTVMEYDKQQYVSSLMQGDHQSNKKMYQINMVKNIEQFCEDKYTSLENTRFKTEKEFE